MGTTWCHSFSLTVLVSTFRLRMFFMMVSRYTTCLVIMVVLEYTTCLCDGVERQVGAHAVAEGGDDS